MHTVLKIYGWLFPLVFITGMNVCLWADDCSEKELEGVIDRLEYLKSNEDDPVKESLLEQLETYLQSLIELELVDGDLWKCLEDLKEDLLETKGLEEARDISDAIYDRKTDKSPPSECDIILDKVRKDIETVGCEQPYDRDKVLKKAKRILRDEIEELEDDPSWNKRRNCRNKLKEIRNDLMDKGILTNVPRGTGQTTGHIATIPVTNEGSEEINVAPQTFYIPSRGGYQNYVGRIPPGITVPPGETVDIPVEGYCTDVSKPPVATRVEMPPLDEWVPVFADEMNDDLVQIVPGPTQPAYTPSDIGDLRGGPGFQAGEPTVDGSFVPTWPGTDQGIPGTITIDEDPERYGSLFVEIVRNIESAADNILNTGEFTTPASGDPERERTAVIQQTVWITCGLISGRPYSKEEFQQNVYEDFEARTGTGLSELDKEEKEKLASGVDEFWNAFTATGVEAKVIKHEEDVLFDQRPCDWRKICIDVFIMARREGNNYDLGYAYRYHEGFHRFVPRSVEVSSESFQTADGALADISEMDDVSLLVDNIQNMLSYVSTIYEPCCIWFELNKVYAVDPSRAQVSGDGTKLDEWVDMNTVDEDGNPSPRIDSDHEENTVDGTLSYLDAVNNFVDDHSGLASNDCLKLFMGSGFTGGEAGGGIGQKPGTCSSCDLSEISPRDNGAIVAHEIGHNLGLDHSHGGENNLMAARTYNHNVRPGQIYLSDDQCEEARQRADRIGTEESPPENSGNGDGDAESDTDGPNEGDGRQSEPTGPGGADDPIQGQGDEDTNEDEECDCGDPGGATEGLDELIALRRGGTAVALTEFATCCASVKLIVEVTRRERRLEYDLSWELEYEITDPECFLDITFDRYYNSKRYKYYRGPVGNPNRGTARRDVQVSEVSFTAVGDNRFRMRGDGGFTRDYCPFRQDWINEDKIDTQEDNSLNTLEKVDEWELYLGGTIRCRDGEEIRSFPFHIEFGRSDEGDMTLASGQGTIESQESIDPPEDLVESTIYHQSGDGEND